MLPRSFRSAIVGIGLAILSSPVSAADWPQWLGPKRDGVWRETGILEKLPAGGPKVLWRKPIAGGYSGPAVVGGRVYVMDRVPKEVVPGGRAELGTLAGNERVLCLDAVTGEQVWKHEYDCPYSRISYPQGPRTTPVVAGGRVYTLGTMGDMKCLHVATGNEIWATKLTTGEDVRPPVWGYSAHLLLDGDRLITLVGGEGGAVRAYDAKSGREKWKALTDNEVCYSPPVIAEVGGRRQLIVWTSLQLAGVDPESGSVHWTLKFPNLPPGQRPNRPGPAVNISTPRVAGDLVFVSTAYDGCMCARLAKDRPAAEFVWGSKVDAKKGPDTLPTLMTSLIAKDGQLFGVNNEGAVECVDAATGRPVWKDTGLFQGKEILFASAFWVENGDKVFAVTDMGDLVILKLSAKGYEELSRAHIIDPTLATRGRKAVWAHPAFANQCLITRNDKEIVCVSLAAQ
jgi:outer membrane protein assembly factor BamB